MTSGDWIATSVLAVCVVLGLAGWIKWILRGLLGGLVGALILVVLSQSGSIAWLDGTRQMLNEGRVTPALNAQADAAAVALGITEAKPGRGVTDGMIVVAPPVVGPADNADPLGQPDSWQVRAQPVPYRGD